MQLNVCLIIKRGKGERGNDSITEEILRGAFLGRGFELKLGMEPAWWGAGVGSDGGDAFNVAEGVHDSGLFLICAERKASLLPGTGDVEEMKQTRPCRLFRPQSRSWDLETSNMFSVEEWYNPAVISFPLERMDG